MFWGEHERETQARASRRIAIIGAGAAGLSMAYYLREKGYSRVTVLEKLGRVGGLCRSITQDHESFDLGANYITPAFREVLKLARRYRQETYGEGDGATVDLTAPDGPPVWRDIWAAAKNGLSTGQFLRQCFRYLRRRIGLRRIIDVPGFGGVSEHQDLCVSFADWLRRHGLERLRVLFEMPITVMGYGYVECPDPDDPLRSDREIPAPHALAYMSPLTFITLVGKLSPLFRWAPWPRRFVLGYQRLWEAVAADLNVLTNVDVQSVERLPDEVRVTFTQLQQLGNQMEPSEPRTLEFDTLIVACPLQAEVLGQFLTLTEEEEELFGHVVTYTYQMTSCHVRDLKLEAPIVAAIPLTPVGHPWAITRQYANSDFIQFYSRLPGNSVNYPGRLRSRRQREMDEARDAAPTPEQGAKFDVTIHSPGTFVQGQLTSGVGGPVQEFVDRVGGRIDANEWQTYDEWPYFQHYRVEEIQAGFYDRLESLQGTNRTFYVGGLLNFELVDQIMLYAKNLVRTRF